MTVTELIDELKRMPAHMPVLVEYVEPVFPGEPAFDAIPASRSHTSVAGIAMKYNHVIIDATGGVL